MWGGTGGDGLRSVGCLGYAWPVEGDLLSKCSLIDQIFIRLKQEFQRNDRKTTRLSGEYYYAGCPWRASTA
jgi:hypothetical protein